jgi:hypothetical protein
MCERMPITFSVNRERRRLFTVGKGSVSYLNAVVIKPDGRISSSNNAASGADF